VIESSLIWSEADIFIAESLKVENMVVILSIGGFY
jgi:hypothetical protein